MKIFGIGLAKTGTTSMHRALTMLGIKSIHDPTVCGKISTCTANILANVGHANKFKEVLNTILSTADAFLDWPHPGEVFPAIAEVVPNAKFILTTRDIRQWIDSCLLHVLYDRSIGDGGQWLDIDTKSMRREYLNLLESCSQFQLDCPDRILILDESEPYYDKWRKLSGLTNKYLSQADYPFLPPWPHENSSIQKLERLLINSHNGNIKIVKTV